jgi:hypothetical protein
VKKTYVKFCSLKEGAKWLCYEDIEPLMDEEIVDCLTYELMPCENQEFFDAYVESHRKKFGSDFDPDKAKEKENDMKNEMPEFRYLVEEADGFNYYTTEFETLEEANEKGKKMWMELSDEEKENHSIRVVRASDEWEKPEKIVLKEIEGAFNSDAEH